jgi:hypothetical protein
MPGWSLSLASIAFLVASSLLMRQVLVRDCSRREAVESPAATPSDSLDLPHARISIDHRIGDTLIEIDRPHSQHRYFPVAGAVFFTAFWALGLVLYVALRSLGGDSVVVGTVLLALAGSMGTLVGAAAVALWAGTGPLAHHSIRVTPGTIERVRVFGALRSNSIITCVDADSVVVERASAVAGNHVMALGARAKIDASRISVITGALLSGRDAASIADAIRDGLRG